MDLMVSRPLVTGEKPGDVRREPGHEFRKLCQGRGVAGDRGGRIRFRL
jgi:hypothetical protein